MDETTGNGTPDSGDSAGSVGGDKVAGGPNIDDNRDGTVGNRTRGTQVIAAVIVAIAGLVYVLLQLYGAVTGKTDDINRRLTVIQTAVPEIADRVAALPTSLTPLPPVVIQQSPPAAPTVYVTSAPGMPGQPGRTGKVVRVTSAPVTVSPTSMPTCKTNLLGICVQP